MQKALTKNDLKLTKACIRLVIRLRLEAVHVCRSVPQEDAPITSDAAPWSLNDLIISHIDFGKRRKAAESFTIEVANDRPE
jgi:hypothetical protein